MLSLNIVNNTEQNSIEDIVSTNSTNEIRALYAICRNDVPSEIKVGKISADEYGLMQQYTTRHNPYGFTLLRYWSGELYYNLEKAVHYHPMMDKCRIRCPQSSKRTEWFRTDIETIESVVNLLIIDPLISLTKRINITVEEKAYPPLSSFFAPSIPIDVIQSIKIVGCRYQEYIIVLMR